MSSLLLPYNDLFQEPSVLPPHRPNHDHQIPLFSGSNLVNMKSDAKQHRDVIDGFVKEYLMSGVIQASTSPYASPVVLVRKKDGSWRLSIDYRDLNEITIKDKFPIPLVDDLLDELHGSCIFSKIDLRSGCNQVRMHPNDVHKTTLKLMGVIMSIW